MTAAIVVPVIEDESSAGWFSHRVKTSRRIKIRALVLFLVLAALILWARYGTEPAVHRNVRPNNDANMILTLCEMYRINNGFYPTTEQGLRALVEKPATAPHPTRWTALADRVPVDPWGTEYRYACDDPYHKDRTTIRIISAGKDGAFATADDLILPTDPAPETWRERLRRWLRSR